MNGVDKQERIQRIRIGLTGLAIVFLVVILVTAIGRSSDDTRLPAQNQIDVPEQPNEPLAEIGAAPGTTASNETAEEPLNKSQ